MVTAGSSNTNNGSGTLSFADASGGGATVSSDTGTNAESLIYVGCKYHIGYIKCSIHKIADPVYNPSSGTLTSAEFVGGGVG